LLFFNAQKSKEALSMNAIHLRIPGPTPIPPRIQQAMLAPMIGHRSGEFKRLYAEVTERLPPLFGTRQRVLVLTASGTAALEAAAVNAVAPGEEAIVVVTGAFGDRFAAICERYGIVTRRLEIAWGEAAGPDQLRAFLRQHPKAKAVFLTYCETSTGVLNPVADLARVVREESEALVIVDGVSAIGGAPCDMDAWGLDIVVTGSQKALMLPPGLALIAVSERAWHAIAENPAPRFYLDLLAYRQSAEDASSPYTPAVSLFFGLREALAMIEEETLPKVIARHALLRDMTRAAIRALGLPLLADDAAASPTVTAVGPFDGRALDPESLRAVLRRRHGLVLAGGQKKLKGRIFRIGHMGWCAPYDVLAVIAALETALAEVGYPVALGSGVQAAQEVYVHHVSRAHHGSAV